jgi:hypothetical protein
MGSNHEWWVGKDMKGDKRGPFKSCSIIPAFGWRHCGKQQRNSVREIGNRGGIPIWYLSNTTLEHYRYRHLLGNLGIASAIPFLIADGCIWMRSFWFPCRRPSLPPVLHSNLVELHPVFGAYKQKWTDCRHTHTHTHTRSFIYQFTILWHVDLLLGKDRETKNETTDTARRQLLKCATVLEPLLGSGQRSTMEVLLEAVFSMGPLRGYITRPTELK